MKTNHLRLLSTPAVIGAGLVVAVSGVMMFFGLHQPVARAHEWIGLAFALAIAAHIATHWRGVKGYIKQPLAIGIVAALALATSFLLLPTDQGGHGIKGLIHNIEAAPINQIAPLLERSPNQLLSTLSNAGFEVQDGQQSVAAIAAANGSEPKTLLRLLLD